MMNYRVTKNAFTDCPKTHFSLLKIIVLELLPKRLIFPADRESHCCHIDIRMSLQ